MGDFPEVNPEDYLGRRVKKIKGDSEFIGYMRTTGSIFYLERFEPTIEFEDVNNGDILAPDPDKNPDFRARVRYQM